MDQDECLDFALDATGTGLWSCDSQRDTVRADRRTWALLGASFETGQVASAAFVGIFDQADRPLVERLLTDPEGAMGGLHEVEVRVATPGGDAPAWVALRVRPDSKGGVVGTARDITDIKRYDTQVHLLMREVTHRSKNLLAIIQAMARQTVKDSLSATEFEARFSARLRGLSFSHELLASQDWRGASLAELAEGHLSHLRERHGARIQVTGPVVFIRPEAAQNIGLALNELGSNAQQFGALADDQGTVNLEWHIDVDDKGPQALHLLWTEAGAAAETRPPSRQGFGHRVMERVVARALDGTVTMTFAPTGLRWSLRIPLTHIASEAKA